MFNNKGGSKEMMMGSTIRDLGNTIKEAKNFLHSKNSGDLDLENDLESQRMMSENQEHQMSACLENADEED